MNGRRDVIRISGEVWDEIARLGEFGETPDDVLRRFFRLPKRPPVKRGRPRGSKNRPKR